MENRFGTTVFGICFWKTICGRKLFVGENCFGKTDLSPNRFSYTDFLQDRLCHDRLSKSVFPKTIFSKVGLSQSISPNRFSQTDSFQNRFSQHRFFSTSGSPKSFFPNLVFQNYFFSKIDFFRNPFFPESVLPKQICFQNRYFQNLFFQLQCFQNFFHQLCFSRTDAFSNISFSKLEFPNIGFPKPVFLKIGFSKIDSLQNRLSQSVGWSVGGMVGRSDGRSVGSMVFLTDLVDHQWLTIFKTFSSTEISMHFSFSELLSEHTESSAPVLQKPLLLHKSNGDSHSLWHASLALFSSFPFFISNRHLCLKSMLHCQISH